MTLLSNGDAGLSLLGASVDDFEFFEQNYRNDLVYLLREKLLIGGAIGFLFVALSSVVLISGTISQLIYYKNVEFIRALKSISPTNNVILLVTLSVFATGILSGFLFENVLDIFDYYIVSYYGVIFTQLSCLALILGVSALVQCICNLIVHARG